MKSAEHIIFASRQKTLILTVFLTLVSVMATSVVAGGKRPPGGGTDPAWIILTYEDAITGGVECEEKLSADSRILGCNHYGGFTLTAAIMEAAGLGDCIWDYSDGDYYTAGTIQVHNVIEGKGKARTETAEAVFRFNAPHKDGNIADLMLYVLEAHDIDGWSGPFPPINPGDTTTMTSDFWILRAENNSNESTACLGEGLDPITVTLQWEPLP